MQPFTCVLQLDSDEQSTEDNVGNQQTSTAVRVPLIATQCQGSTAGHSRSSPAYDDEQHDQPHSGNPSEDLTGQSMLASIPAAGLSSWQQPQPGSLAHTHGKRKAVDEGVRTEDLMLSDSVGQRPKLTAQASSCPGDVDAVSMDVIMR